MPGFWTDAEIQVVDVCEDNELLARYGLQVPVLAVSTCAGVTELPRQSPRLSADALANQLERYMKEELDLGVS